MCASKRVIREKSSLLRVFRFQLQTVFYSSLCSEERGFLSISVPMILIALTEGGNRFLLFWIVFSLHFAQLEKKLYLIIYIQTMTHFSILFISFILLNTKWFKTLYGFGNAIANEKASFIVYFNGLGQLIFILFLVPR